MRINLSVRCMYVQYRFDIVVSVNLYKIRLNRLIQIAIVKESYEYKKKKKPDYLLKYCLIKGSFIFVRK